MILDQLDLTLLKGGSEFRVNPLSLLKTFDAPKITSACGGGMRREVHRFDIAEFAEKT
jgi:hypothetical protein